MNARASIKLEQRGYSEAAKRVLARRPALFINNEWVDSTGDDTLPIIDPSNGREVSRIVEATARSPQRGRCLRSRRTDKV